MEPLYNTHIYKKYQRPLSQIGHKYSKLRKNIRTNVRSRKSKHEIANKNNNNTWKRERNLCFE